MPVILILMLSSSLSVVAETIYWQVDCRERLPYMYWSDGQCAGPGPDVVNQAIAALGPEHRITWRQAPWARTIKNAENGKVDLVAMHSCNVERDAILHSVTFGYEKRTIFYYRNKQDYREFSSFEDIKKVVIGVLRNSYYSEEFNSALPTLSIYPVDTPEQLVNMLLSRRIDLAITSEFHGAKLFQQKPGLISSVYKEQYSNSRCISIPYKSNKIVYANQFSKIINSLRYSGKAAEIYAKYGIALSDAEN